VFVDNKRLEQATPVRVADLTPGDHQIKLEADGYAPWESSLHVTPGTVLDLPTAQLIAHAQELDSPPSQAAPSAPSPSSSSSSSTSALSGSRSSSRPRSSSRTRNPDEMPPSPPVAQPEPQPEPEPEPAAPSRGVGTGTLRVQTRPWSKVSIDGRPVGTTPLMNVPLSAGSHTLTFTNDDFGIKKVVKVQIEAGQVLTQVLTLTE
jgi:hypothetical protein